MSDSPVSGIDQPPAEDTSAKPVPLLAIFGVFFQIGALSFGGGLTGWAHREVSERRRWLTNEEFMSGFALAQVLPGVNISNLAIYVGLKLRGGVGSTVAIIALLAAPFFSVILLYSAYDRVSGVPWLALALDGVAAAAVGLLLLLGVKGALRASGNFAAMVIVLATTIMIGVLQWPLLPVVFGIAPIAVALFWPRGRRDA